MLAITLLPNAEGKLPELQGSEESVKLTIGSLEEGMESGSPSIVVVVEDARGNVAFAQTSLKLLLTAADTFAAVHGDPR